MIRGCGRRSRTVPDARRRLEPGSERRDAKRLQRSRCIRPGINRLDGRVAAPDIAPVQDRHLGFLDVTGVRQKHRAEIARPAGRMHRAREAGLDQLRQQAAVIEVRMGQHHRIE